MQRENRLKAFLKVSGLNCYKPDEVSHLDPPTNEERSAVEVFDFVHNPPDKYFLYVSEEKRDAHTWTGQHLGKACFGRQWRDNFGGIRVPVEIYGINGWRYVGTYFKSSGDFARIRKAKDQP